MSLNERNKSSKKKNKSSQIVKFHPQVIMILVYIDLFLKDEFNGGG
jgi:hypothetical protein